MQASWQLPRRDDAVECMAFRCLWGANPLPHRYNVSRYSPYHSDKLSRLAPLSELNERHSLCGTRSLAEGRPHGAHFAGAMGVISFLNQV
jgi:hypothetical protein